MRKVHVMTAKIGERSAAESPPIAPLKREVLRRVRPLLHRPKPQIIMQIARHGRSVRRTLFAPINSASPGVDFANGADGAALNQFDHAAIIVACMNLRAHLRDALLLARRLPHNTAFGDGMGERLLTINVAPALERCDSGD